MYIVVDYIIQEIHSNPHYPNPSTYHYPLTLLMHTVVDYRREDFETALSVGVSE